MEGERKKRRREGEGVRKKRRERVGERKGRGRDGKGEGMRERKGERGVGMKGMWGKGSGKAKRGGEGVGKQGGEGEGFLKLRREERGVGQLSPPPPFTLQTLHPPLSSRWFERGEEGGASRGEEGEERGRGLQICLRVPPPPPLLSFLLPFSINPLLPSKLTSTPLSPPLPFEAPLKKGEEGGGGRGEEVEETK